MCCNFGGDSVWKTIIKEWELKYGIPLFSPDLSLPMILTVIIVKLTFMWKKISVRQFIDFVAFSFPKIPRSLGPMRVAIIKDKFPHHLQSSIIS